MNASCSTFQKQGRPFIIEGKPGTDLDAEGVYCGKVRQKPDSPVPSPSRTVQNISVDDRDFTVISSLRPS